MSPAVLLATALAAGNPLVRTVAGAEVDFGTGTITARAGAAADYRLPSPDVARPGAERRARAAALARLRAALAELKVPAEVASRAKATAVDYQSNGGVLVTMAVTVPEGQPSVTLSAPASSLVLAPVLVRGTEEAVLGWAIYRLGVAPSGTPAARRDGDRLKVEIDVQKLAGAGAVIYVGKVR